jgi:hypothetical protein
LKSKDKAHFLINRHRPVSPLLGGRNVGFNKTGATPLRAPRLLLPA